MQAAEGMHIEWVEDEAVVLDPETSRLHYLNPPAAYAYALILEHGYEVGLREMKKSVHHDGVDEELEQLVTNMVEIGLLVDG